MKQFFAFVLILITALSAQAIESKWSFLDEIDGQEVYANPKFIEVIDRDAGIIEVWFKYVNVKKTAQGEIGDSAKRLAVINCATKEFAFKQVVKFDKFERVISHTKATRLNFYKAVPDTISEIIVYGTCSVMLS